MLGGTFDPVHYAHLAIAEQVRDSLQLDGILFIPAGRPVHKPAGAVGPAQHRLRMVELAIHGNSAFVLDPREVEEARPSYSVETIAQLRAERPDDEFHFIVSAEAVQGLPRWRSPQRLLELSQLVVVPRLGYGLPAQAWFDDHFPNLRERFTFVETTHLGHSASDIRARVAAGRSIRYLVPSDVEAYIREKGLYRVDD